MKLKAILPFSVGRSSRLGEHMVCFACRADLRKRGVARDRGVAPTSTGIAAGQNLVGHCGVPGRDEGVEGISIRMDPSLATYES